MKRVWWKRLQAAPWRVTCLRQDGPRDRPVDKYGMYVLLRYAVARQALPTQVANNTAPTHSLHGTKRWATPQLLMWQFTSRTTSGTRTG